MKYRIITIISFIGSTVISLLGGWDKSLQTLIIFMTIDWLTGGILLPVVFQKSPKSQNGALESHAGWKGLCRKAMTLFYVLSRQQRGRHPRQPHPPPFRGGLRHRPERQLVQICK